jgi:hypothetical protein
VGWVDLSPIGKPCRAFANSLCSMERKR